MQVLRMVILPFLLAIVEFKFVLRKVLLFLRESCVPLFLFLLIGIVFTSASLRIALHIAGWTAETAGIKSNSFGGAFVSHCGW
jgi:hypothetical protein